MILKLKIHPKKVLVTGVDSLIYGRTEARESLDFLDWFKYRGGWEKSQ